MDHIFSVDHLFSTLYRDMGPPEIFGWWPPWVFRNLHKFAIDLNSQRSHPASQWARAAGEILDTCFPATWLPGSNPSPSSQIPTNSQSSVIRTFRTPIRNKLFCETPAQVSNGMLISVYGSCLQNEKLPCQSRRPPTANRSRTPSVPPKPPPKTR